jgi:hypothetical protein
VKAVRGLDEVQRNLAKALREMEGAALEGLVAGGQMVRKESQKLTPIVTGNLRGSAFVVWKGGETIERGTVPEDARSAAGREQPTVAVGYAAVYAANVHENPRAGKTGGASPSGRKYVPGRLPSGRMSERIVYSEKGEWKFLETALKVNADRFLRIVAARVRKALKDDRGAEA